MDYTVEYYTTGHLAKFVRPGAYRIASTASGAVPNVAWRNPDGSKALYRAQRRHVPAVGEGGLGRPVVHLHPAGTPVQIWTCFGGPNQTWTRAADGTLRSLGKCLDVSGGGTADGTKVQLWTCNGTAAQQWTWTAGRDLKNPQANKCLDVTGNTSADGTKTPIWSCTGGANQKWTLPA